MYRKYLLLFVLLFPFSYRLLSQSLDLSGSVRDLDNRTLSNITIKNSKGKVIGISDSEGNFSIKHVSLNDSLYFSSLGFSDHVVPVEQFKSNGKLVVSLREKQTQLNTLHVVVPGKERLIFGLEHAQLMLAPKGYDQLKEPRTNMGTEQAMIIKVDQNVRLLDLNYYIVKNPMKEISDIKYRLKLYEVKDNRLTNKLIGKPIEFHTRGQKGWIKVELNAQHLVSPVSGKIGVGVEWLSATDTLGKSLEVSKFLVPSTITLATSYMKESQGHEWEKVKKSRLFMYFTGVKINTNKLGKIVGDIKDAEAIDD